MHFTYGQDPQIWSFFRKLQLQNRQLQLRLMYFSLPTSKFLRFSISNIQTLIDINRTISHRKFQMMNHIIFSKVGQSKLPAPPNYLQKNEIETRILKCLYDSGLVDLGEFRFDDDIRVKHHLDSLDVTALVSSIEQEFNTIFDPETYDSARSLDVIVQALLNDDTIV